MIFGHYQAGYTWGIIENHVSWSAVVHKGGALVGTSNGRLYDRQGPEHITEEGVRAAVLDTIKKLADDDEDDLITEFRND